MKKGYVSLLIIVVMLFTILVAYDVETIKAQDEYDTLRMRWHNILTGGTSYNPQDPDISDKITFITSTAQEWWDAMDKSINRTYVWSDIPDDNIIDAEYAYVRLRDMAIAYSTWGSPLYNNGTLRNDIISALDWQYENRYNESKDNDFWFKYEVGVPMKLLDIVVLIYDDLTLNQITDYLDVIYHFSPDPTRQRNGSVISAAANRVFKVHVAALRGVVIKDGDKIAEAGEALNPVFYYVTSGQEGFYTDGSYIQHVAHAYTGGYGRELLHSMSLVFNLFEDSSWELTDPNKANVYRWIHDSFEPIIYKGALMDMTRGRQIARHTTEDHATGHSVINSIIQLIQYAPSSDADALKSMVKYWIQADTYRNFFENALSIHLIVKAKEIMNDNNVTSRGELIKSKQFPSMDRTVHLRPGFGYAISMFSSRIFNYEMVNTENLKGWYTGDGMTQLYNEDLGQFSDYFWPTVNPYRLPGITVDAGLIREDSSGRKTWSSKDWVGGSELLEAYSVTGMELEGWGSSLTAKKSWFMFDDEIVALGAGITSTDNRTIESIVENRMINSAGDNALTVNGSMKSTSLSWTETMNNVNWIHLEGNTDNSDIGYYFPEASAVKGLREARSGSWSDINQLYYPLPDDPVTRNYMTLWYDHGSNPTNETYSYVLLPNKSSVQVSSYSGNPDVIILENSTGAQAVKEQSLKITGVNFWNDIEKTVDMITSDKKASVMLKETDDDIEIAISDPTQSNTGYIDIEIDRAANGIIFWDHNITVTQLSPTIKLSVYVDGKMGAASKAKFSLGTIFKDDFNEETTNNSPSGWTVTNDVDTSSTVVEIPSSANKSVELYDNSQDGFTRMLKAFEPQTGIMMAEWKFKEETAGKSPTFHLYDGSTIAVKLAVRNEGPSLIYYDSTDAAQEIQTISSDTWYTVQVIADVTTNTYNIYVDGVLKVSGAEFTNTVQNIDRIRFSTGVNPTGTLYINDVVVKDLTPLPTPPQNPAPPSEPTPMPNPDPILTSIDFNNGITGKMPYGWDIVNEEDTSITVAEVPSSTDKSARLYDNNTSGFARMFTSFEPQSGTMTAEWKIKEEIAGKGSTIRLYSSHATGNVLAISLSYSSSGTNRLRYHESSGATAVQNVESDTWYTVRVIADIPSNKYDIYVDGELRVTEAEFLNAVDNIDRIRFGTGTGPTGTTYVDDVLIYKGAILVNDHFNSETTGSLPSGWTVNQSGGSVTVEEVPTSTNKSIELLDTSSTAIVSAAKTFAASATTVIAEYKVRFGSGNFYYNSLNSGSTQVVLIRANNGYLQVRNGGAYNNLQPYAADTWYEIKIVANPVTDKADIYVDGVLRQSQGDFYNTAAYIDGFRADTHSTGTDMTMNIDDVFITN